MKTILMLIFLLFLAGCTMVHDGKKLTDYPVCSNLLSDTESGFNILVNGYLINVTDVEGKFPLEMCCTQTYDLGTVCISKTSNPKHINLG